jgi:integrase
MEALTNPVQNVREPKPPPARDRRLQPGEEERLSAAAKPPLQAVILFALETAARQGEIVGLTWKHVDLNSRTAYLADTKTGEPRKLPLFPTALEILSSLPRRRGGGFRHVCQCYSARFSKSLPQGRHRGPAFS